MANRESLVNSIERNKEKLQALQEKIRADEKKLQNIDAAEIKLLMHEIDATGISTKEVLKAIRRGDFAAVEKLLKEDSQDDKEQETGEKKINL